PAAESVPLGVVFPPKLVARFTRFHCTTEDETKPVPVTVRVKPAPPTVAVLGDMLLTVGAGFGMDSVAAAEAPPPGAGVKTVIAALPAVTMSVGGMEAVSSVALTKVVGRAVPFQRTMDEATKSAPLTVSVTPALPTVTLLGERLVTVGTGFVTDKLTAPDVPPPGAGVKTGIAALPAAARRG